jgi:hypothetical protein
MGTPRRKEKHASEPAAKLEPGPTPEASGFTPWERPQRLSLRGRILLGLAIFSVQIPLVHYFLLRPPPDAKVGLPYVDDFAEPSTVEKHYWSTGGHWRTVNGELLSPGVKNNPLWLQAKLPPDVVVEFDVRSQSPEGDIKAEIFGDGSDHASGYVLIHGGWNNSMSIIARLDEHGVPLTTLQKEAAQKGVDLKAVFDADTRMRVEAKPFPVEIGRRYRWRIERKGSLLRWSIDGKPFMEFDDPYPLKGKGHDRFGFSSWEAQLYFDNLRIEPLVP